MSESTENRLLEKVPEYAEVRNLLNQAKFKKKHPMHELVGVEQTAMLQEAKEKK
jgi:hypothetical protein